MYSTKMSKLFLLASVAFFTFGGAEKGSAANLNETKFKNLAGWSDDDHSQALGSFKNSCNKFSKENKRDYLHKSKIGGRFGDWQDICTKVLNNETGNAKQFFETYFKPFTVNREDEGLFTGYFQATLNGSLTKTEKYKYPVYGKPKDLVSGKKYLTRKKIQDGALEGKGLELVWVDNAVDLFFMHVQGSGMVNMDDGSKVKLGYAGKNNHKYTSIARKMINDGLLDGSGASAETVKEWFKENPTRINEVLAKNKAYIFFQKGENADEGPIGSQGVPLTAMRSIAVDKNRIPYGVPMWLDVKINKFENKPEPDQRLKSLVIAQDTGSAIKGDVRADIFFGFGEEAEQIAGVQQGQGKYYMLLPRPKSEIYIEEPIIQVASAEPELLQEPTIEFINEVDSNEIDSNEVVHGEVSQDIEVNDSSDNIEVASALPMDLTKIDGEIDQSSNLDSMPNIEQLQIASNSEIEAILDSSVTADYVDDSVSDIVQASEESEVSAIDAEVAISEVVQIQEEFAQLAEVESDVADEFEMVQIVEAESVVIEESGVIDNVEEAIINEEEVIELAQDLSDVGEEVVEISEVEIINQDAEDVEVVAIYEEVAQIAEVELDGADEYEMVQIVEAESVVDETTEIVDANIETEIDSQYDNKDQEMVRLELEAKEEIKQDISNLRITELQNKISNLRDQIAQLQSQIDATKTELEFEMQSISKVSSVMGEL